MNHYYAQYDDRDGVVVLFEHTENSRHRDGVARGRRRRVGAPGRSGAVRALRLRDDAVAHDAAALRSGDAASGREWRSSSNPERFHTRQLSAFDWSPEGWRAARRAPHRCITASGPRRSCSACSTCTPDASIAHSLPREEMACRLATHRLGRACARSSEYDFRDLGDLATSPIFVPREPGAAGRSRHAGRTPGGLDGWVVVPVMSDAGFRVEIFDAARRRRGPVCTLAVARPRGAVPAALGVDARARSRARRRAHALRRRPRPRRRARRRAGCGRARGRCRAGRRASDELSYRFCHRPRTNTVPTIAARATWSNTSAIHIHSTGRPACENAIGERHAERPVADRGARRSGVTVSPAPRSAPAIVKWKPSSGCVSASVSMNGPSSASTPASSVKTRASGARARREDEPEHDRHRDGEARGAPARAHRARADPRAERVADQRRGGGREADARDPRERHHAHADRVGGDRRRAVVAEHPEVVEQREVQHAARSSTAGAEMRPTSARFERAAATSRARQRERRARRGAATRTASSTHGDELRAERRDARAGESESRQAERAEDQEPVEQRLHRRHDHRDGERRARVARRAEAALERDRDREEQRRRAS